MVKKALAIDIGGTKIFSALIDETGKIIGEVRKNSTPGDLVGIIKILREIITQDEGFIDVVAISTAGAVNLENNAVISATGNLPEGYRTIDFPMLSKRPVFVENDANCAAWAEYKIGASKNLDNNITLTFGTGVGGGIIVNGKLMKGKSGSAGEMHFKMALDEKRKCTCGAYDCFEIYTSGKGLILTAKDILGKDLTTYEIIEGYKGGYPKFDEIMTTWRKNIAKGIVGLCNIFDPDCVVLSGSLAQFIETEPIQNYVNNEISTMPTKIFHASAGNYSGMIGAALLALEKFK
ncbi:MAG: ROK family protein [Cyanobacteria bacterium SIG30]|nr:ROK family protein [Cyanobacteria bacterium SIG30]